MNLLQIKIRLQLVLGFSIFLLLVVALSTFAYLQSNRIHEQTELMYQHPLEVRHAIGRLHVGIVSMQRDLRNMMISDDQIVITRNLDQISDTEQEALNQMTVIADLYLGPKSDVDSLENAFRKWTNQRRQAIQAILKDAPGEVVNQMIALGKSNHEVETTLRWLEKIDAFAIRKSAELYANSEELTEVMNRRLLTVAVMSLLLAVAVFLILIRNIRRPINELNRATRAFHSGDLGARSRYKLENEFGELSDSFNNMAEDLSNILALNKKIETIERLMLGEDDAGKFFHSILAKLCEYTGSQTGAAYILSDNKSDFVHFASIGLSEPAKGSFSSAGLEGEFGMALASQTIQHIKTAGEKSRFTLNTVNGGILPAEILTIPIVSTEGVIAVISLATVGSYCDQSVQLVEGVQHALGARVEGILAYRRIKEILAKLEVQNKELEVQKTELLSQSAMLTEQNTELEAQKQQLAEASRLKTNFLSNMSHELRTPLNSVIALSGVLNRRLAGKIPEEEYSYLDVIIRNGKNLLALINDILDISRIESGREEIEITKFNINQLVGDTITMIQPQAKQKNIELNFVPGVEKMVIATDADMLNHILQNIIGNAVKFTLEGAVTVSTAEAGDRINITVTDTGIGIAEDQIRYIFDEFRQADGGTSRRFGGTGLGLALARKYTMLLGGEILVKSTLDHGSEFTVSLPLNYLPVINKGKPNTPASLTLMMDKPEPDTLLKTILLVEDSEPAIIQIRDLLEEQGLNIIVARDGTEALAVVELTIPDAMILDLMMPGIDGFQVLESVRASEKTARLPVLILTSKFVTKSELGKLKENNIHQLLRKGDVDPEELVNVVKNMLHGK